MTHIPASPGTAILTLDDDRTTVLRTPVVAYEVIGSIAYPITPLPLRGLLKAKRALLVDGFVIDRGVPIPFANEDEWLAWAGGETPEEEPEDGETVIVTETPQQMAARLRAENGTAGHTDVTGRAAAKPAAKPAAENNKPRKTFASKSFWSRTSTNGSTEIAEIEPGFGLPRDHEGWEKIKREEFAAFKRDSKGPEATVTVVTWGKDGPAEQQETEAADEGDFGGLV